MKEATGELSMTLVTVVAVVAIGALIYVFKDPIMKAINARWNDANVKQNIKAS